MTNASTTMLRRVDASIQVNRLISSTLNSPILSRTQLPRVRPLRVGATRSGSLASSLHSRWGGGPARVLINGRTVNPAMIPDTAPAHATTASLTIPSFERETNSSLRATIDVSGLLPSTNVGFEPDFVNTVLTDDSAQPPIRQSAWLNSERLQHVLNHVSCSSASANLWPSLH